MSALIEAPLLFQYRQHCGQYPGAVGEGATVSMQCFNEKDWPTRYVIVQFPTELVMNFCELDVCAKGQLGRPYFIRNLITIISSVIEIKAVLVQWRMALGARAPLPHFYK